MGNMEIFQNKRNGQKMAKNQICSKWMKLGGNVLLIFFGMYQHWYLHLAALPHHVSICWRVWFYWQMSPWLSNISDELLIHCLNVTPISNISDEGCFHCSNLTPISNVTDKGFVHRLNFTPISNVSDEGFVHCWNLTPICNISHEGFVLCSIVTLNIL